MLTEGAVGLVQTVPVGTDTRYLLLLLVELPLKLREHRLGLVPLRLQLGDFRLELGYGSVHSSGARPVASRRAYVHQTWRAVR